MKLFRFIFHYYFLAFVVIVGFLHPWDGEMNYTEAKTSSFLHNSAERIVKIFSYIISGVESRTFWKFTIKLFKKKKNHMRTLDHFYNKIHLGRFQFSKKND